MKLADTTDGVPMADRSPTPKEIERFRLLLSVFRDGSGMESGFGSTLPGWRDFEDAVDAFFGVSTPIDKDIFDVAVPYDRQGKEVMFGVSCKMKKDLDRAYKSHEPGNVDNYGRVFMELANPAEALRNEFLKRGFTLDNYHDHLDKAGEAAIDLIRGWHNDASIENGGNFALDKSCYLSLLWGEHDGEMAYRLYGFEFNLPDPTSLDWISPSDYDLIKGCEDDGGVVFSIHPTSGGQIKYYPNVEEADWMSDEFTLAPIDEEIHTELEAKAEAYFDEHWTYTFKQ
ncbi:hypothetical protein [Salinibacter ruber]|uniref:hypothetical protein n=1 Tax=Salinibacter ruber TaxID=146919 RepID=UPI00216820A3|nr:hypothetical protein [Salinibacter ruber]MCS3822654.1 hypothetical protein [Salinibacter ruber]